MVYKKTLGDRIFNAANFIFMILIMLIMVYPCWYVLMASFSDPVAIYGNGGILLWPKHFGIYTYQEVLKNSQVWLGYRNTVLYVACGGLLSLFLTISAAFCLTRRGLPGRNGILFLILFTMYFSGGLVPGYLLIKNLGMINTVWALVLPGALNVYNMIVCRSFFMSNISDELFEATKIDGGSYTSFFFKVVLPLSKSIIAVMVLYHALVHWNSYLSALYYIRDTDKYPLQLILRNLTASLSVDSIQDAMDSAAISEKMKASQTVRYAVIIVASIPVFLMYPFVQKYFVKGVMVGSVKG